MTILINIPDDLEAGLTQLTNFPTMKPKIKLVSAEVIITAYWMPWAIMISFL